MSYLVQDYSEAVAWGPGFTGCENKTQWLREGTGLWGHKGGTLAAPWGLGWV